VGEAKEYTYALLEYQHGTAVCQSWWERPRSMRSWYTDMAQLSARACGRGRRVYISVTRVPTWHSSLPELMGAAEEYIYRFLEYRHGTADCQSWWERPKSIYKRYWSTNMAQLSARVGGSG